MCPAWIDDLELSPRTPVLTLTVKSHDGLFKLQVTGMNGGGGKVLGVPVAQPVVLCGLTVAIESLTPGSARS